MKHDKTENAIRKLSDEELDKLSGGEVSPEVMSELLTIIGPVVYKLPCPTLLDLCNNVLGNTHPTCGKIHC